MPQGFQVFGPNGQLWADSNLMPVGLIKSGYLATGTTSVVVTADNPTVFFRTIGGNQTNTSVGLVSVPNNVARLESLTVSGSTWTFTMEAYVNANGGSGGQVIYYIFDTKVTTLGNSGIQIWDDTGKLTFNSNHPPLRITGTIRAADEFDDAYVIDSYTKIALPAVPAFSMATYRRGFAYKNDGGGGFTVAEFYKSYTGIPSAADGVFTTGWYVKDIGAVGGAAEESFCYQGVPMVTIADVARMPVPFG